MAVYQGTQASVGAPTCNGVNGSGYNIIKYMATAAGLTILYDNSTDTLVLQIGGGVVRFCHNSATSGSAMVMTVRMAESASGISTLTDETPLTSLVADNASTWMLSSAASATARDYYWQVDTTNGALYLNVMASGIAAVNGGGMVIWPQSELPSDPYTPTLFVRNTTSTSPAIAPPFAGSFGLPNSTSGQLWTMRSPDGAVKSIRSFLGPYGGAATPSIGGGPACPHPVTNNFRRQKVFFGDNKSQTLTAAAGAETLRAWVPGAWAGMHSVGNYSGADYANGVTFPDSAYDPSSSFRLMLLGNTAGQSGAIAMELTDTWQRPTV